MMEIVKNISKLLMIATFIASSSAMASCPPLKNSETRGGDIESYTLLTTLLHVEGFSQPIWMGGVDAISADNEDNVCHYVIQVGDGDREKQNYDNAIAEAMLEDMSQMKGPYKDIDTEAPYSATCEHGKFADPRPNPLPGFMPYQCDITFSANHMDAEIMPSD